MAQHAANDDDRASHGRQAERPREIPRRGWADILVRVKEEVGSDNASLIAAGLALYALLAIFPALAAAVSLYGLFASPEQIATQVQGLAGVLPQQAADILRGALQNLASQQGQALGIGAVVGFLLALWSARKGMVALMTATNIAYDEEEERGFFRKLIVSLGFTIAAVVGFVLVVALAVGAPLALEAIGAPSVVQSVLGVLRWVVLWFLVVLALAVVYRYAPDRRAAKWRWVTWGSATAATLWLAASLLFSLYVQNFGSYGETYGALAGVIVLLLWFYLSAFVVVLGAEINAEIEHQTERDTTVGRPKPAGRRGAHVADTLGHGRA
ncbi:MAG TPA: YihY/virulence factor BrkB family protein [Woeseiaceae bacterium]|nr:YihY/virulence factor BrkB family protein [Woeseiaceae bacterium]